jgi:hypothetical protein
MKCVDIFQWVLMILSQNIWIMFLIPEAPIGRLRTTSGTNESSSIL